MASWAVQFGFVLGAAVIALIWHYYITKLPKSEEVFYDYTPMCPANTMKICHPQDCKTYEDEKSCDDCPFCFWHGFEQKCYARSSSLFTRPDQYDLD